MSTVRTATHDLLRRLGLTTIFGNPGSTEQTFLQDLPADLDYVLGLQEASVVAMADGFAQVTGRPALVNLHTAAGVGHAMTSIMTAYQNRTPLVVTAGQQTRQMLLMEPYLTNVDPTTLPRPWVKWSYQPDRPQDVPAALQRAFLTAQAPPQGPVFLSLPMDDWDAPAGDPVPARSTSTRTAPDPQRLALVADALRGAERPALVVGGGVDRSTGGWSAAIALAEHLVATVYTAPASERPGFPEDHPLHGGALPYAIAPLAEQLAGHDVVVVVGAPVFRYYPYVPGDLLADGTVLWHVTDDPHEAARAPVGDAVLGDAALALQGLVAQLADIVTTRTPPQRTEPEAPSTAVPLTGDALVAVLHEQRRPGTVLVAEAPSNLPDLHARWPVREPASFFTFASGALGWGLPAAVGIALGERATGRDRPVLAVIGDGSLQYSVQALWTAAQRELPLVVVVPRNGQYTILKSFAEQEGTPGVPGLDLPGIDVVGIARGYGADAVRAESADDVRAALADAAARPGPTVIEVPTDTGVPPLL